MDAASTACHSPAPTLQSLYGEALALAGDIGRLARLEARLALRAALLLAGLLPLLGVLALGAWLCLMAALWLGALALTAPPWLAALLLLGVHAAALRLAWSALRRCADRATLPRLRASLRELRTGLLA
ncbi:MAG: phage holin family protein [Rhodanobacteraceae bacterium]|nr:phage holin family protein [Rhodanobacteraceae bacterium]